MPADAATTRAALAKPLDRACRRGALTDVRRICEENQPSDDDSSGWWCELTTAQGLTPLATAAQHGHAAVLGYLLATVAGAPMHAVLDRRDHNGWLALHHASAQNHAVCVRQLLARDADPNARTQKHRTTPLMLAARRGHGAVLRALLECKALDADAVDSGGGMTAMHFAALHGHAAACAALGCHCDVGVLSTDGHCALALACTSPPRTAAFAPPTQQHKLDVVRVLVQTHRLNPAGQVAARGDITAKPRKDEELWPVALAASHGWTRLLRQLLLFVEELNMSGGGGGGGGTAAASCYESQLAGAKRAALKSSNCDALQIIERIEAHPQRARQVIHCRQLLAWAGISWGQLSADLVQKVAFYVNRRARVLEEGGLPAAATVACCDVWTVPLSSSGFKVAWRLVRERSRGHRLLGALSALDGLQPVHREIAMRVCSEPSPAVRQLLLAELWMSAQGLASSATATLNATGGDGTSPVEGTAIQLLTDETKPGGGAPKRQRRR